MPGPDTSTLIAAIAELVDIHVQAAVTRIRTFTPSAIHRTALAAALCDALKGSGAWDWDESQDPGWPHKADNLARELATRGYRVTKIDDLPTPDINPRLAAFFVDAFTFGDDKIKEIAVRHGLARHTERSGVVPTEEGMATWNCKNSPENATTPAELRGGWRRPEEFTADPDPETPILIEGVMHLAGGRHRFTQFASQQLPGDKDSTARTIAWRYVPPLPEWVG